MTSDLICRVDDRPVQGKQRATVVTPGAKIVLWPEKFYVLITSTLYGLRESSQFDFERKGAISSTATDCWTGTCLWSVDRSWGIGTRSQLPHIYFCDEARDRNFRRDANEPMVSDALLVCCRWSITFARDIYLVEYFKAKLAWHVDLRFA